MVRSLCGEVTNSDAPSLMRTWATREAVSNFWNLLCVKLAYHCCDQNAL